MNLPVSAGLAIFLYWRKGILRGQRLGFVIFYGMQEAGVFLSKLQEIRVNDLSLRINMTRFGRDSPKP